MQAPERRAPQSSGLPSLGRIVVAEDERIVARDLTRTLTRLGYLVVATVARGDDAVQKALELQPELVLMDIHLEGAMDGIEAAARINRERTTPIVYLTAYSDRSTVGRARHSQPFGYLVKPYSEPELCCAIEMALHKDEIAARLREREESVLGILRAIAAPGLPSEGAQPVSLLQPVADALTGWTNEEAVGTMLDDIRALFEPNHTCLDDPMPPPIQTSACLNDALHPTGGAFHDRRVVERTTQLQAASRGLEAFSAAVADDLRAPLHHLDTFSQELIESHATNLGAEGLAHLHRVRAATERMKQLIDDLLRRSPVAEGF